MDGSFTDRNENAGAGIYCKLFSFYLLLGKQATHFDGETETNTAIRQLFSRTGSFEKAVIFSDSTSAILSTAQFDTLPNKRRTEIHSPIKLLEDLQKAVKFQWIPSHCGVVDNGLADYFAKKGTVISQTFTFKLSFHSAKLKIKRSIQADLSRYYTTQSQHKPWNKTFEKRYIIPDSQGKMQWQLFD
jgi:ribonuclease HI